MDTLAQAKQALRNATAWVDAEFSQAAQASALIAIGHAMIAIAERLEQPRDNEALIPVNGEPVLDDTPPTSAILDEADAAGYPEDYT